MDRLPTAHCLSYFPARWVHRPLFFGGSTCTQPAPGRRPRKEKTTVGLPAFRMAHLASHRISSLTRCDAICPRLVVRGPDALGARRSAVIAHPRPRPWLSPPLDFVSLRSFSCTAYFCTTLAWDSSYVMHPIALGAAPTVINAQRAQEASLASKNKLDHDRCEPVQA